MEYSGIDVSQWNGYINWDQVATDDVSFAIIRSSYGSSGIDNQFVNNMNNISRTAINPGAYHYSYALSPSAANTEANHFINVISPYEFKYPVVMDIEDSSLYPLGTSTITDIALEFCNTMEKAGYYVSIYSNLYFLNNYLDMSRLSQFDLWLAQWASAPTYTGNFGMWQYSSTGSKRGISGNVDLDKSYKNYPAIISNMGLNKPTSPNDPPSSGTTTYTVVEGDSLWSIAERFLGSGTRYTEIKAANGLSSDTIYPGQVLIIPSSSSSPSRTYTVVSGDSLWSIAERFLGSGARYTEIKAANGLSSDTIYPGQVLIIPSSSSSPTTTYTVVEGDSLWSIAERFLGSGTRYTEIKNANGLTSDTVYPGQVLIIP